MRSEPLISGHGDHAADRHPQPYVNATGFVRRAGAWFLEELRKVLPPTLFFFGGFNLIVLTTNLILADYLAAFGNFMVATGAALVVGKAVLVADEMSVVGRY